MCMNVFVGNLSAETTEQELIDLFAPHGEVEGVKIILDFESGDSKGYAFVRMLVPREGREAILALNGVSLHGLEMEVNAARSGQDRRAEERRKKPHRPKKHKPGDKRRDKRRTVERRVIFGLTRGDDDRLKKEQEK